MKMPKHNHDDHEHNDMDMGGMPDLDLSNLPPEIQAIFGGGRQAPEPAEQIYAEKNNIDTGSQLPGILALFAFNPATAPALNALAEAVLISDANDLSRAERELIFAWTSAINGCDFCSATHAECAVRLDPKNRETLTMGLMAGPCAVADISERMHQIFHIAHDVAKSGKAVSAEYLNVAREAGLSDNTIHDVVLVAAMACMFNRYVDGLMGNVAPERPEVYRQAAEVLCRDGYIAATQAYTAKVQA